MAAKRNIDQILKDVDAGKYTLGAVFADKMLTMTWKEAEGWQLPVIRPYGPLPIMPASSALNYALSAFDAFKAYNTTTGPAIFRATDHLKRLQDSAVRVSLPAIPDNFEDALISYVHSVREWIPKTPPCALYLRAVVFSTSAYLGVTPPSSAALVIMASPVAPKYALEKRGLNLLVSSHYMRAGPGGLGGVKASANYAAGMLAQKEAKERGFDFVLWLSDGKRRHVTEIGAMNIFFVYDNDNDNERTTSDGNSHGHYNNSNGTNGIRTTTTAKTLDTTTFTLVTPQLDDTILPGVTRKSILNMAEDAGMTIEERAMSVSSMFRDIAEGKILEIFGCGTASCVISVQHIECDGKTATLKDVEDPENTKVGLWFRSRLHGVFRDGSHQWMTRVGKRLGVDISETNDALCVDEFNDFKG